MSMLMAVDPGDVRIGLAVSDPSGTISRPLKVIRHRSRREDAARIIHEAEEHAVEKIIVGLALDREGEIGPQARKAMRLVDALRKLTILPIETWDESGSSVSASRKGRKKQPIDSQAAAVILQEYLDATRSS
jgi:putative Holliday junction resolvase